MELLRPFCDAMIEAARVVCDGSVSMRCVGGRVQYCKRMNGALGGAVMRMACGEHTHEGHVQAEEAMALQGRRNSERVTMAAMCEGRGWKSVLCGQFDWT
jgi:hypothetical protein